MFPLLNLAVFVILYFKGYMMKMTFLGPEAEGRRFSLWRNWRHSMGRQTGLFCAAMLVFSCELYTPSNNESSTLSVTETTEQGDNTLSGLSILYSDMGSLTFQNRSGEWIDLTESSFDNEIKDYKLNLNIGKNMTVIVAQASSNDAEVMFKMNDQNYPQGVFRDLPPARGVIEIIVKPKTGKENIYTIHLDRTVLNRRDFETDEEAFDTLNRYLAEVAGDREINSTLGTLRDLLPIRVRGLDLTDPSIFAEQPVFKGEYNLYLDLDLSGCTVGTPVVDSDSEDISGYIFYRIDKNIIPGIEYIVRFTLPESVTQIADESEIGAGVFSGYTNLQDIVLPGIKKIGKYAFSCTNLKTIDIPAAEEIEESAFALCINITAMNIPKLRILKAKAFDTCITLKSFSAPKISAIDDGAFSQCYALSELKLGSGGGNWTTVGVKIFENLPDSRLKQLKVYNASGVEAIPVTDNDTYWGVYKDNAVSSFAREIPTLSSIPWNPANP